MKKLLLVLGASMLVLSACHRATEDGVTSPSIPREQQTKDTSVQSPMAATVAAMDELQLSNPTDQSLIIKNYSDFQKLIQYNTEKWEEEFASWASSMGQSYHRLEHANFDEKNELIKKLETTTVSQKSVKWNVLEYRVTMLMTTCLWMPTMTIRTNISTYLH